MLTKIIAVVLLVSILIGLYYGLKQVFEQAEKFYQIGRDLEERIKRGDKIEEVYVDFIKLREKAFERNTHAKVYQLGKMIEVKYDIKVFA